MTHHYKAGDKVRIMNTTPSGEPFFEGHATIKTPIDNIPDIYDVTFDRAPGAAFEETYQRFVAPPAPPAVIITISGGLVQTVTIDGQEVHAEIWDYDTDGAGPAEIETDDDGDEYVLRYS